MEKTGADEPAVEGRCIRIQRCTLRVGTDAWPFAKAHAREIAAYWQQALAERPKLFDGTIYLLQEGALHTDAFRGTFVRADFKSFLYWRETGFRDGSVRDGFGSAVIRSAEGHVLLGRQTSGNVNAGLAYPPGGFIDARDVREDAIDIEASVARELLEETGLDASELARTPGFLLTLAGPLVSIGIEWRSPLPAETLRARILAHVRAQAVPELADATFMARRAEIGRTAMPDYARLLLKHLLPA